METGAHQRAGEQRGIADEGGDDPVGERGRFGAVAGDMDRGQQFQTQPFVQAGR
ncbi:hypothetical protein OK351_08565 [Glutamicibacter sp. MNS18]|uniref:hypothetical protein n=1 Tax=Glutamicibacter sp. MNS18 TaxID=2989817 RepID=UPI0022360243|nr:hypothetical protein [Glutamicibacter sp. MNS18]MCW4465555.1 hypothetical protein [Glutamicibacter sp. MNS18]